MNDALIKKSLPGALAMLGAVLLAGWWFGGGAQRELTERLPGTDRVEGATTASGGPIKWDGRLVKSNGVPAELPGSWPRFRGPDQDGISKEEVPLAKSWANDAPKALWSIDVGEGFAGAAVWKGRAFVMDYDRENQADALRCLSLADGNEIWRYTYSVKVKRNHGMSRTIPTVTDKYIVSMGPKCQVTCIDPMTGDLRWVMDLVKEFNTEIPQWYAGQCPLVEGDRVILAPGGDALLAAVDCQSGKVIWKTPNPKNWQMTHSSVVPFEFKGRRMYAYCASKGVVGVSAADGALLWETPDWKISIATVPSPVPVGEGRLFLSGGYEAGSMMIRLNEVGTQIKVETLFRLKPTIFGATQQTPILFQNHLYGVRPDGQLVCLDLEGKLIWKSGGDKFGNGPFMIAQGIIYAMNDEGMLSMAEASTTSYKRLCQSKVLDGPDAWGPMALAGGRLIVRDMFKMVCLDVAAH